MAGRLWVARIIATMVLAGALISAPTGLQAQQANDGQKKPDSNPVRQEISRTNQALVRLMGTGHYRQALDFAERLYPLAKRGLAEDDPVLLSVLDNLATLYVRQGRYEEGGPLLKQAFEQRRDVLGKEHPDTLSSLNTLAFLHWRQGRYGTAETLYKHALRLRRKVLGDEHPDTLVSLNSLAVVYFNQSRFEEAEPLYKQVLEQSRRVLGEEDPDTLITMNNLAVLYEELGRYRAAEPLFKQVLELRRKVLGEEHPETLTGMSNLAGLYMRLDRPKAAEPLYNRALELRRKVLGEEHPATLVAVNNLAAFYSSQGIYGAAEHFYQHALEKSRKVLGEEHPDTLVAAMNFVVMRLRTNRPEDAAKQLERIGGPMLRRTGTQLTSTRQASTKRRLLQQQSRYQDVVIRLAAKHPSPRTIRLAADTILRWKHLSGKEEAFLAQLIRTTDDPDVAALGTDIVNLRADLAETYHQGRSETNAVLLDRLEGKESSLSWISEGFKRIRTTRTAGSRDVEAALPEGSALIEFRLYRPVDGRAGSLKPARWAAVLLRSDKEPLFADVGSTIDSTLLLWKMNLGAESDRSEFAAQLYKLLFGAFEDVLAESTNVYISPDGALNLIPFDRLRLPDGRFWMQRQTLRIVHSGRSLLEKRRKSPNKGLVAFGGVDFFGIDDGLVPDRQQKVAGVQQTVAQDGSNGIQDPAHTARGRLANSIFGELPATKPEVETIGTLYSQRRQEKVAVWSGSAAREARVKTLKTPPRVLHFATHGFFLPAEGAVERPMLMSGLAFSGVNLGIRGYLDKDGEDGVLFAIEASGLNLHDTEMVVMSACDTAQGNLNYSEGVYGLARGFRIAGAQNTLMTLWALKDRRAKDFMIDFYTRWLQAADRDPVDALRETKLAWAASKNKSRSTPEAWAPYVIIQNGR